MFPVLGERCRATVVTKAAIEICREAHFESARAVFGFELDEAEPPLIRGEGHRIGRCFVSGPTARGERFPYGRRLAGGDQSNLLTASLGVAPLDWLDAKALHDLEDGRSVGAKLIGKFRNRDQIEFRHVGSVLHVRLTFRFSRTRSEAERVGCNPLLARALTEPLCKTPISE